MSKQDDFALLVAHLAARAPDSPHLAVADAKALRRLGARYRTLQVRRCNGEGTFRGGRWECTDADDARADKTEARIRAAVEALAAGYGLSPVFSGDPRGDVLRLQAPGDDEHRGIFVA